MNAWKDGRAPTPGCPSTTTARSGACRGEARCRRTCSSARGERRAGARELVEVPHRRAGREGGGVPAVQVPAQDHAAFRLRSSPSPEGPRRCVRRVRGPSGSPSSASFASMSTPGSFAKMLAAGRFHAYAASFRFERGRWVVAITGVAASCTTSVARHRAAPGDGSGSTWGEDPRRRRRRDGRVLHAHEGVKALQRAQARLKLANQSSREPRGTPTAGRRRHDAWARSTPGSRTCAGTCSTRSRPSSPGIHAVTIEDLTRPACSEPEAGPGGVRRRVRGVPPPADVQGRLVRHRARHRGPVVPLRKTCSGCGAIDADLTLSDRVYACSACGLVLDRDVNAAINLARYTAPPPKTHAATCGRLTPAPCPHPDGPGREPTATRTTKGPWVGTSTRPRPRRLAAGRQPRTRTPVGVRVKGSR